MFGVQKILAIWKKFCQIFSVIPSFLYENGLFLISKNGYSTKPSRYCKNVGLNWTLNLPKIDKINQYCCTHLNSPSSIPPLTYKQSSKPNACGFTSCVFGSWILIFSAMNSVMKHIASAFYTSTSWSLEEVSKNEGRRSEESYHVIHNMAIIDVITPLNSHCRV